MSDKYKVIYSSEAINDLREIYLYIAFDLKIPGTAENQASRIRKKIRSLDFMPHRYTIVDWEPWQSMNMHKMPVDNFIVYYIINSDTYIVTVVRIFYGGRDIANIVKDN